MILYDLTIPARPFCVLRRHRFAVVVEYLWVIEKCGWRTILLLFPVQGVHAVHTV